MQNRGKRTLVWFASLLTALFAFQANAAMNVNAVHKKPFAVAHVALQISDANPFKQTLVLNVAQNLINHYGQDRVDVEVVAYGPGLRLLFAGNSNAKRIDGLAAEGVRFSACHNTIMSMTKQLGYAPKLNPHAVVVPGGIVRLWQLYHAGYMIDKP